MGIGSPRLLRLRCLDHLTLEAAMQEISPAVQQGLLAVLNSFLMKSCSLLERLRRGRAGTERQLQSVVLKQQDDNVAAERRRRSFSSE